MVMSNTESIYNQQVSSLLTDYFRWFEDVKPLILEGSGYTENITPTSINAKDLKGLGTWEKNEVITAQEEYQKFLEYKNSGNTEGTSFTDKLGRLNTINPDGSVKITAGSNEFRYGTIEEAMNAAKGAVEKYLPAATENTMFDPETGNLTQDVTSLTKTKEREELEAKYKEISDKELEQRLAALNNEFDLTDPMNTSVQENYRNLQEAYKRKGVDIEGDDWRTATAKDSAGIQVLEKFRQGVAQLKQQYNESILNRSTSFTAALPYQPGAIPQQNYNPFVSAATTAQQPYQYYAGLNMQQQLAQMQQGGGNPLWGSAIGALGSIGGAFLGGPLGASLGGTAASTIYQTATPYGYSPQFGNVGSPY